MLVEPHYGWHEDVYEDAKAIGALMGMDIENIYFSGFSSQGDGACFEGSLHYRKGCVAAVKSYAGRDTELHDIATRWQEAHAKHFYQLSGSVKHSGHYYHEFSTSFYWERSNTCYGWLYESDDVDTLQDIARDFMRWIYRHLETEYEYQSAWEAARQWQDAQEEMTGARAKARVLVADMRKAIKSGQLASDSICKALRAQLRGYLSEWETLRETRDELASDFHYWPDNGKSQTIEQFATENL